MNFLYSNDKIAVDCQWGEWKFGECSATCGNGTRTNTRTKLTEEQNGGTCSGSTNETESCNVLNCPGKLCPYYSQCHFKYGNQTVIADSD